MAEYDTIKAMSSKDQSHGLSMVQVVTWAIAVIVPSVWASVNISESKASERDGVVDSRMYEFQSAISELKTRTERISKIEDKVDALLITQGVNPKTIK
jgi:hypothetical protein